jgi:hypothetical protein
VVTKELTWPSSGSTTEDNDAAKEDGSSAPSSTKSQIRVAKAHKASSSALDFHCTTCSAPSYPVTSSSQSASWAQPHPVKGSSHTPSRQAI